MSRIAAVDAIFQGAPRLYVHFGDHHQYSDGDVVHDRGDGLYEICLNPSESRHREILDRLLESVSLLYVHTIHLAELVLPWLSTGKVVVDFHGVVPEEEAMLGRPELAPRYELVEKEVLSSAMSCVMVSFSMQDHYVEKYPDLSPKRCIILPIVEAMRPAPRLSAESELPVRVVYAGGTQTWQNVDAMLSMAGVLGKEATFRFFSHDHSLLRSKAEGVGVAGLAEFCFMPKAELAHAYAQADFGLVLRDDSPVNRVSSPTKIFEYLQCGVIPVVRSPRLGDFESLGYQYVTEQEFIDGFFPDAISREWMVEENYAVATRLRHRFVAGASELAGLVR